MVPVDREFDMPNSGAPIKGFGSSCESTVLLSYVDLLRQVTRLTHESPTYRVEIEGMPDKPFRGIVCVGTENFPSSCYFVEPEEAKEDAARVAYEELSAREYKYDEFAKAFHLIDQEETPCMAILNDFHKRENIAIPLYYVVKPEGPCAHFIAAVTVGVDTYTGEQANTEEQAKKNAAHTAVKSILATRNGCMLDIFFSKRQRGITSTTSEMMQMSLPSPAVPAANEYQQDDTMIVEDEQMQQYPPHLPMSFLPHELMKRNACVTRTTSEMMQMLLPSQATPAGDVAFSPPGGISANEYQDDYMIIDEVDNEESESLSGKKRKMDANEGPADNKQARI